MSEAAASGGLGFTSMLTILFIGLKLAKLITWSWWWVLAPTWISLGLALIALGIAGVVFGIVALFSAGNKGYRNRRKL